MSRRGFCSIIEASLIWSITLISTSPSLSFVGDFISGLLTCIFVWLQLLDLWYDLLSSLWCFRCWWIMCSPFSGQIVEIHGIYCICIELCYTFSSLNLLQSSLSRSIVHQWHVYLFMPWFLYELKESDTLLQHFWAYWLIFLRSLKLQLIICNVCWPACHSFSRWSSGFTWMPVRSTWLRSHWHHRRPELTCLHAAGSQDRRTPIWQNSGEDVVSRCFPLIKSMYPEHWFLIVLYLYCTNRASSVWRWAFVWDPTAVGGASGRGAILYPAPASLLQQSTALAARFRWGRLPSALCVKRMICEIRMDSFIVCIYVVAVLLGKSHLGESVNVRTLWFHHTVSPHYACIEHAIDGFGCGLELNPSIQLSA